MAEKGWRNGGRYVGPGVALASLAVIGTLLFRSYQPAPPAPAPEPPPVETPAPPPQPPPAPVAPPAVGRADLIAAATAAAAAYAAGTTAAAEPSGLVGRRFRIRLPFGCEGPARGEETRSASWSYSADPRSIRIVVRPENWTDAPLIQEVGASQAFEAAEGFWIRRPWLLSEDCPTARGDPLASGAPAPSAETVGLVMFFEAGSSRIPRRQQRPYEVVVRLPEENANPAPQGFRLILEGRLTGFETGRAFHCRSASQDQRPVCIARVALDTVAVENPASARVLATWDVAQVTDSPR